MTDSEPRDQVTPKRHHKHPRSKLYVTVTRAESHDMVTTLVTVGGIAVFAWLHFVVLVIVCAILLAFSLFDFSFDLTRPVSETHHLPEVETDQEPTHE